jgi:hypothetical protein
MAKKYFQLEDHVEFPGRWYLNGVSDGSGRELDSRDFTHGRPVDVGPPLRLSLSDEDITVDVEEPLRVSLRRKGKPLDFTFADFDMPVANKQTADLLATVAGSEVQRLPIRVATRKEQFEIINVASQIDCIDVEKSEIEWWTEEDERPDKIGTPRMISKLVIDPKRISGTHIFRPKGWDVVIVVSDVLKQVLEEAKVTGIRFGPT